MSDAKNLTIGQVAKRASVNVQTLRYYERRNLVLPKVRKDSGYRLYDEQTVRTVQFVKHAQEMGFTLEEIRSLLSLRVPSHGRCNRVLSRAKEKLSDVKDRIKKLKRMESTLKKLISDCENKITTDSCPIIESMEDV